MVAQAGYHWHSTQQNAADHHHSYRMKEKHTHTSRCGGSSQCGEDVDPPHREEPDEKKKDQTKAVTSWGTIEMHYGRYI